MKFTKTKHVFLPSLKPDYFSGFPGFYLSSREAMADHKAKLELNKIEVIGPKGLHQALNLS